MTAEAADTERGVTLDAPGRATPTPEDDERLRGLVRAELERQHAMPLARRTLELLAEAETEPNAEEPGYRVIDRNGETRLIRDGDADPDEESGDVTSPMTLRGLVAELRERHPDLFVKPPEPEDVDPVPPPPPEPPHDALADVKAAGARFVETQSALAKTIATSSAERGRTLASAASGRIETWRGRLGDRFKAKPAPVAQSALASAPVSETPSSESRLALPAAATVQPGTEPETFAKPAAALVKPAATSDKPAAASDKPAVSFGSHLADLARRGRDALPVVDRHAFDRHAFDLQRVAFVGLAAATVLVIGVVVFMNARREDAVSPVAPESPRAETPKDTPKAEVQAEPAPEPRPASPEPAPEDAEAAPVEEAPRNPNDVVGVPQVVDTATLKLSGKVIHLFGVEWVRGGQGDELTKYIRGRSVTCRPASGSSAFLCAVDGRDLSEVVLFNGGGRASSEASPDLVAAEDHARTERLGVWKR